MATIIDGDIQIISYDLNIANGDFVLTPNAEQQETDLIINSNLGNWFEFPVVGVGIINYVAGNTSALTIENAIKNQMIADGFKVTSVNVNGTTLNNFKLNIQAHR